MDGENLFRMSIEAQEINERSQYSSSAFGETIFKSSIERREGDVHSNPSHDDILQGGAFFRKALSSDVNGVPGDVEGRDNPQFSTSAGEASFHAALKSNLPRNLQGEAFFTGAVKSDGNNTSGEAVFQHALGGRGRLSPFSSPGAGEAAFHGALNSSSLAHLNSDKDYSGQFEGNGDAQRNVPPSTLSGENAFRGALNSMTSPTRNTESLLREAPSGGINYAYGDALFRTAIEGQGRSQLKSAGEAAFQGALKSASPLRSEAIFAGAVKVDELVTSGEAVFQHALGGRGRLSPFSSPGAGEAAFYGALNSTAAPNSRSTDSMAGVEFKFHQDPGSSDVSEQSFEDAFRHALANSQASQFRSSEESELNETNMGGDSIAMGGAFVDSSDLEEKMIYLEGVASQLEIKVLREEVLEERINRLENVASKLESKIRQHQESSLDTEPVMASMMVLKNGVGSIRRELQSQGSSRNLGASKLGGAGSPGGSSAWTPSRTLPQIGTPSRWDISNDELLFSVNRTSESAATVPPTSSGAVHRSWEHEVGVTSGGYRGSPQYGQASSSLDSKFQEYGSDVFLQSVNASISPEAAARSSRSLSHTDGKDFFMKSIGSERERPHTSNEIDGSSIFSQAMHADTHRFGVSASFQATEAGSESSTKQGSPSKKTFKINESDSNEESLPIIIPSPAKQKQQDTIEIPRPGTRARKQSDKYKNYVPPKQDWAFLSLEERQAEARKRWELRQEKHAEFLKEREKKLKSGQGKSQTPHENALKEHDSFLPHISSPNDEPDTTPKRGRVGRATFTSSY